MTVPAERTLDNSIDVSRKAPTTALADKVLTGDEGVVIESVVGPGIAGFVELSQPAVSVAYVLVHDGAGDWAPGGVAPAAVPVPVLDGTHFTVALESVNGVLRLTESGARDYSGSTLIVAYSPKQAEGTIGGQSTVSG